ncbi:hypothetical protein BJ742DRAFT_840232 [Cladochytrium replicatum]|nr:hypothetical protein BJ742DRAFT_840232 [Cladochytrium replicatum]
MSELSRRYTFVIEQPDLKSNRAQFADLFRSPNLQNPDPVNLSTLHSPPSPATMLVGDCPEISPSLIENVQAKRPPNSFLIFVCQFKDVISRMLREKRTAAALTPQSDPNLSRKLLSLVWHSLSIQPRTDRIRSHYKRLAEELDKIHRHYLPGFRHKVQKMVPEDRYRKYEVELHRMLSAPPSPEMSNDVIVRISRLIDLHIHEAIHGPPGGEGLGKMEDGDGTFVIEDAEDETERGREVSVVDSAKRQRSQSHEDQTNGRKRVRVTPAILVGNPLPNASVDRVRFSPISADSSPEFGSLKWIPVLPPVSTTPATRYLAHELLQNHTTTEERSALTINANGSSEPVNYPPGGPSHFLPDAMSGLFGQPDLSFGGPIVDFNAHSHPDISLHPSSVLDHTHFPVSAPTLQSAPLATDNDTSRRWEWDIPAITFHVPPTDVPLTFANNAPAHTYNPPFGAQSNAAHTTDADFLPFHMDGVNAPVLESTFAAQGEQGLGVFLPQGALWLPPHGLPKTKTSTFYTLNPLTGDVSAWLVCETEVE